MSGSVVERVRGTNDLLPEDCLALRQIEERLRQIFEAHGYRPVEVPILEHTDLFLRKSGEEIVARMYAFSYRNRRICLRPEFTASIMRAYVHGLQGAALPLRLYYCGPAFRYEKPQRGRYRQFTQMGVELIGASGPLADAEAMALACQGLEALGLRDYHLVLGHLGVLVELLDSLRIDERVKSFLLSNLERLGRGPRASAAVLRGLAELYPALAAGLEAEVPQPELEGEVPETAEALTIEARLRQLLKSMAEEEARLAVQELLGAMGLQLNGGGRSREEIAARLVDKFRQEDQTPRIRRALEFIEPLRGLRGTPPAVFQRLKEHLSAYGLSPAPLDELDTICCYLADYGIPSERVTIDLGLGRGLLYYTGTIFEIYHHALRGESQLCGGGRYDDLIRTLGGKEDAPACGFSYGLERVKLALEAEGASSTDAPPADVLVIPVSRAENRCAILLAEFLRRAGLAVELEVRERGPKAGLKYAARTAIPFAILVGGQEVSTASVLLRDMSTRQERLVPWTSLRAVLEGEA